MLEVQLVRRAASRACAKAGIRMLARIEMMAITTSSSISVNALRFLMGPTSRPQRAEARAGHPDLLRILGRPRRPRVTDAPAGPRHTLPGIPPPARQALSWRSRI